MSDYRRWFVPGGTYFFTIVTYARRPILVSKTPRDFACATEAVQQMRPFRLVATVLLPDHCICDDLPAGDFDYPTRLKQIKEGFTKVLFRDLPEAEVTESQSFEANAYLAPRYWEHTITDEDDLEGCVDYIHWNPRNISCQSCSRLALVVISSIRYRGTVRYQLGGEEPNSWDTKRDWGE